MNLPEKSTLVTPHLTVRDVREAMDFYDKAFGFKRKFMLPVPGGKVVHGEMVHGDCTIMVGPEALERGIKSPVTSGAIPPVSLFIYVDDVDKLHKQAMAAGAKEVLGPNEQFFGARTCLLLDPDGHQWMFATHQKNVSVEEMTKATMERDEAAAAGERAASFTKE